MNDMLLYSLVFMFSVFISSVSQILLKKSAMKTYASKIKEYLNPLVIIAYGVFFVSSFITTYAYRHVPLSFGAVLESTAYVYIGVLGYFILKEKISKRKLLGMVIIIAGIILSAQ